MKPDFWHQKWKDGDIKFHQEDVHPFLVKHYKGIAGQKVLVPLCGKSKDMLFIREFGNEVVGVELSPLACEAFFKENKIPFEKKTHGAFMLYQGKQITLWCGSFFDLPKEVFEKITYVYDRAALYALPEEMRKNYSKLFNERGKKGNFKILLLSIVYDQTKIEGPAFSISEKVIRDLYGEVFEIQKIESDPIFKRKSAKFKDIQVTEEAYWLKGSE